MEADAKATTPTPRGTEAVVRFTTKLSEQYQVPDDDLVVPANLARYGLSEVVNRLLSFDEPVPFDFLADGEFLRMSIAQYLESKKLSSEKVLNLEYVLAITEPEQSQVDEAPDWIAGVAALGTLPTPWFSAVACDGTFRVYEGTTSRLVANLSSSPLTAVAALPMAGGASPADSLLLMASKDGGARCAALRGSKDGKTAPRLGQVATLRAPGALQAAQAVAISEDGTLLSAAGWSNDIEVWNADPALFAEPDAGESAGSKRKSPAADAGEGRTPKFSLQGHSQVVSALHFGRKAQFPYTLLSGSWDSSMRVWDIAAASCVCNWTVARAVTSFSVCPDAPRLATAHEDGHVSLWDVRAPPHPAAQGAVSLDVTAGLPLSSAQIPHRRLVSQVAWCPQDATLLASVAHDGQLCILDPRSPKMPLQSLRLGPKGPSPVKLLCVTWLGRDAVALGGSDGKVMRITVGSGAAAAEN